MRLDALDLVLVDDAHALDAVLLADGLELEDVLHVMVGEAHHELAGPLEGHAELGCDPVELLVALDGAFGFERAGLVGEAGVQHAGVAAAVPAGDVELLLQNGDVEAVACELARHRGAHNARPDDDNVPLLHTNPSWSASDSVRSIVRSAVRLVVGTRTSLSLRGRRGRACR